MKESKHGRKIFSMNCFVSCIHIFCCFGVVSSFSISTSSSKQPCPYRTRKHPTTKLVVCSLKQDIAASGTLAKNNVTDTRPFEQRVSSSRPARRMNHPFRYLFRHDFDNERFSANQVDYLRHEGNFSLEQIEKMETQFPALLQLATKSQLHPKMMFLKMTLGVPKPAVVVDMLPPQFFGARLERVIAPRHAFLQWIGLPSGKQLFQASVEKPKGLFGEFLLASRSASRFAALCQSWLRQFRISVYSQSHADIGPVTAKHVEAFETIFSRGLMAAVRNDLVQFNNTWSSECLPSLTAANITRLLISHGANPRARDHRGATLLHWACGTGNWETASELLPFCNVSDATHRDGSTPLHWASAGTTKKEFGVGGHVDVCRNLLLQLERENSEKLDGQVTTVKEYVNCLTFDGNTPLMWAAWSGTLETVKLLVRNLACTTTRNRNGCTVAHWAASGGNLKVCQYLADIMKVDFLSENHGGNTPLTHAVAFGHAEIVQWLLTRYSDGPRNGDAPDDSNAFALAQNFVQWTDGNDIKRRRVFQLFEDEWMSNDAV